MSGYSQRGYGGRGGGGYGGGGYGGRGGGGGGGRGEYYRNKYGGGRGRGRGGGDSSWRGDPQQQQQQPTSSSSHEAGGRLAFGSDGGIGRPAGYGGSSLSELARQTEGLEGRPYGGYRSTLERTAWASGDEAAWVLVDRVQGDAYAPPSRCRAAVNAEMAGLPKSAFETKAARVAAADWLCRRFVAEARRAGDDARTETGGWGGQKGGEVIMAWPSQFVLERTAVRVEAGGQVEARFTVALPARGRSIEGRWAARILCDRVPAVARAALCDVSSDPSALESLEAHVDAVLDQQHLRSQLAAKGLVAFVADGCVLPRYAGDDDRPMDPAKAVPFDSAGLGGLRVELDARRQKKKIAGLGLPKGVSLICGGGFHGKSTLLSALRVGGYDKIPGDGREGCVGTKSTSTIKAEDGRAVRAVDVSPFINGLPGRVSANDFATDDASGSTSQAAAVAEALEAGADCLLFDEDTCATNFMVRDARMRLLVPADPITPYLDRVRHLADHAGVSSILVVGGVGDYLGLADAVVLMHDYKASDATVKAREIADQAPPLPNVAPPPPAYFTPRAFQPIPPHGKVATRGRAAVQFGDNNDLNLLALDQLVELGQTRAVTAALVALNAGPAQPLAAALDAIDAVLDDSGIDAALSKPHGGLAGDLARPRRLEIAAAFNRLRTARFRQIPSASSNAAGPCPSGDLPARNNDAW